MRWWNGPRKRPLEKTATAAEGTGLQERDVAEPYLFPHQTRFVTSRSWSSAPGEGKGNIMAWKIPFGRAKGETLDETDAANITWVMSSLETKLKENPDKPFADKDRAWIVAAKAELKRRDGGGAQKPAANAPAALVRAPVQSLGANMNDPAKLTEHLTNLSATHHVVSPATTIDVLPPGCGIAVSYVLVDTNVKNSEVYEVGGKMGLSGTTLARIAAAAGVDWDASQSGRLDNGSDPHYCHFRAVGHVRNFDGSVRTISGEVEIDAREGSPQVDEIRAKAAAKNKDGALQLQELRKFVLRHAESKAKNRAIAGMGVKRSYNPAELSKPFAVCRLMWTGETQDPELRRLFAEKTADMMLSGMSSMYGKPAPQPAPAPHALPSAPQRFDTTNAPQFRGHAPPAVGPAVAEVNDFDDYDFGGDEDPTPDPKPEVKAKAASATVTPIPNDQPAAAKRKPDVAAGEADY